MELETIYYDLSTDKAYRANKSEIANDNIPQFRYKGKKQINWQLLNSATLTNDVFADVYTGFSALTVSATASIDNDAKHYDDGAPNATVTGGVPITTMAIKNLTDEPRICGRLKLTNASGETETINYNGWSLAATVYTFTLANASYVAGSQTPTYTYLATDDCRVLQIPIVKDAAVSTTGKATGLFVPTMDCFALVYQDMIEGNTEIAGCKMELIIADATPENIMVKQIPVKLLYVQDDDGAVGPAPDNLYLTDAQNELKYEQLIAGTQTTLTDNATTNINIFDKTAARGVVIDYVIVGAAGMRQGTAKMCFFSSTAYVSDNYIEGGAEIAGITWGSDISSNNVRANVTLAATGENLKIVYRISQITLET